MENIELRTSVEAPPSIHNKRELTEFKAPGSAPASACCGHDHGHHHPPAPPVPEPAWGPPGCAAWFGPGLESGFPGAELLVFNLVIWNIDARKVDEVMWKSGCRWSCERPFCMNL